MIFILILCAIPLLVSFVELTGFLAKRRSVVDIAVLKIAEIGAIIILPYIFISMTGLKNECCGDSAIFSPDHQLTMLVLIALCVVAYFYSSYRTTLASPVIEVFVNSILLAGIVLNVFIAIQIRETFLSFFGNLPIIIFMLLALIKNEQLFLQKMAMRPITSNNKFIAAGCKILQLKPGVKFPLLFILFIPVIIVLTSVLLLFGQKPDSLIRAFTDTYRQGFSLINSQCDNVNCGGHYLCSVAANGHREIVRPQRIGIRNGNDIICNRQLLVSNAFEELVQERWPRLHKHIRGQYNKVGNMIHRYYHVFNNKMLSDIIYILMKPLEWLFLLVLYTFDKKPENRIAKQYISHTHRQMINNFEQKNNVGK